MTTSNYLTLYTVSNNFGNDLSFSATNDLQTVTLQDRSKQRVLRRLLTNPGDYIQHPEYGAGLGRYVGEFFTDTLINDVKSKIQSQLFLEDTVSKTPPPQIKIQTFLQNKGIYIQINYKFVNSNIDIVLTFSVPNV